MELLKSGYNKEYLDYICKDEFGNLITPNFITDHFRHMIKKCGFKQMRFHDLRHSCASLLLANGISMKQIQVLRDLRAVQNEMYKKLLLKNKESLEHEYSPKVIFASKLSLVF